jgi:hypothetical protein
MHADRKKRLVNGSMIKREDYRGGNVVLAIRGRRRVLEWLTP